MLLQRSHRDLTLDMTNSDIDTMYDKHDMTARSKFMEVLVGESNWRRDVLMGLASMLRRQPMITQVNLGLMFCRICCRGLNALRHVEAITLGDIDVDGWRERYLMLFARDSDHKVRSEGKSRPVLMEVIGKVYIRRSGGSDVNSCSKGSRSCGALHAIAQKTEGG